MPLSLRTQEWLYAVACIQQEEIERIKRFVFRSDTKLALVSKMHLCNILSVW